MTDPNEFAAGQIGQLGQDTRAADPGSAVVAPPSGMGVTEINVAELAAQIAAMQAQIDTMTAEQAKAAGNPLADTVKTIQSFLVGHGDPVASALGDDLAAAVDAAGQSGDTSAVAKIAARLDRHLARNQPYPGENYHFRNAVSFVRDLPDLIDEFKPVAEAGARDLVKVVAGSVIG